MRRGCKGKIVAIRRTAPEVLRISRSLVGLVFRLPNILSSLVSGAVI